MFWILIIVLTGYVIYVENKFKKVNSKQDDNHRLSYPVQLSFNLTQGVIEEVIKIVKIKSAEEGKKYQDWSDSDLKKWQKIVDDKNSDFSWKNTTFSLTYLSSDDAFALSNSGKTSIILRRTSGNTHLFDSTVLFYPSKDKKERTERIRLQVVLRNSSEGGLYHVITVGIREYEDAFMGKSKYTKIADFPFSKSYGYQHLEHEDYNKFGFEVELPSPWPDKDEFGELSLHPWDTEITYKHRSGIEITQSS